MKIFGERIKGERKLKGWSQVYLAGLLHVEQKTISHWGLGRRQPSFEMVIKIAEVLGCDINFLFGFN